MAFRHRWIVLAVAWALSHALFERVGSSRWGLDTEFLVDLALLPALQALGAGPFLRPAAAGPVAVTLRLLAPLFPLHLVVTAGVAYLFGHVDLRPHTVAGLFAVPLIQGGALAGLLPGRPSPDAAGAPSRPLRDAARLPAILLLALVAAFAADALFGWYGPTLSRLFGNRPPVVRALAGYLGAALAALGLLLALRGRVASRRAPALLLDLASAALLATLAGALGQYYQRPVLVPPWSTLLPAGLWLSAASALAALGHLWKAAYQDRGKKEPG